MVYILIYQVQKEQKNKFDTGQDIIINIKKYFFIEVRSDKDSLFEHNTDHYRRFLNFEKLLMKLIKNNFEIKYSEISDKFAPYNNNYDVNYNENTPKIIRIICKLKS